MMNNKDNNSNATAQITRLGLDLGTNSIGWCLLELDKNKQPISIIDMGVRLFSDGRNPKDNSPLNVTRQLARQARRTRKRKNNRVRKIIHILDELNYLPEKGSTARKALFKSNPYELRANAASQEISKIELARVLIHICKRRGFKSNRKSEEKSLTVFKEKIKKLSEKLNGKTLGQFLWENYNNQTVEHKRKPIRFTKGEESLLFPSREMYEQEFNVIKEVQQKSHQLTAEQWQLLYAAIFDQRPLRPQVLGKCSFYPDQDRAYKALPSSELFRIHQEVNNLEIISNIDQSHRKLTEEERTAVFEKILQTKTEVTFTSLLKLKEKKQSLFDENSRFNLETEHRNKLKGANSYQKIKDILPRGEYSLEQQDEIVKLLIAEQEEEILIEKLNGFELSDEQIDDLVALHFQDGVLSVSSKFIYEILPGLQQGAIYDKAVKDIGLHHSELDDRGVVVQRLPYYGAILTRSTVDFYRQHEGKTNLPDANKDEIEFGKIGNPTVHVALNQIRKLVNAIADEFGIPSEIHVEVARELKQSREKRSQINSEINKNTKANDIRRDDIKRITQSDRNPSRAMLEKYKLWEELGRDRAARACVFTGKTITCKDLFSPEVQVEHILPFSQTYDDSLMNKTLCWQRANNLKGKQSPFDAFGSDQRKDQGIIWSEILRRIDNLPAPKKARFSATAMSDFKGESGFLARQATDNAYIARIAREYLGHLVGRDHMNSVSGRVTELLRRAWKLNFILNKSQNLKLRDDHRHHSVDAFVVAMCNKGMIKKLSTQQGHSGELKIIEDDSAFKPLKEKLIIALNNKINDIIPSVKPDHSHFRAMYDASAYGFVGHKDGGKISLESQVIKREDVSKLSLKKLNNIRNEYIKRLFIDTLVDKNGRTKLNDSELKKNLLDLSEKNNIRKVRILYKNTSQNLSKELKIMPIPSAKYKGYLSNQYVCCDIWAMPGNNRKFDWKAVYITVAKAYQGYLDKPISEHKPHPAAKYIMRLYKDDLAEIVIDAVDEKGHKNECVQLIRIFGFAATRNKIDVRSVYESNNSQNHTPLSELKKQKLRKVCVSIIGRKKYVKR